MVWDERVTYLACAMIYVLRTLFYLHVDVVQFYCSGGDTYWCEVAETYSSHDWVCYKRRTDVRSYDYEQGNQQPFFPVHVCIDLPRLVINMFHSFWRFLFDNRSPAHVYYRWKLFSILQVCRKLMWFCSHHDALIDTGRLPWNMASWRI